MPESTALAIILHTKYITDDVNIVHDLLYTSASESESESELNNIT